MQIFKIQLLVIVIVIVIFRQGVHSANTDFQWSPDNNNIQNIIATTQENIHTPTTIHELKYKYLNVDSLTASTTLEDKLFHIMVPR